MSVATSTATRVRSVLAGRRDLNRRLRELECDTTRTMTELAERTAAVARGDHPAIAALSAMHAAATAHASAPKRDQRVEKRLTDLLDSADLHSGVVLEIGGERELHRHVFASDSWTYSRIDPAGGGPLDADIADCPELPDGSYDVVLVLDALNRLPRPWDAAQEIARLLRPGGIVYTTTVFAWRYLPQPEDYWRFSPECVASLFPGLETLQAEWDVVERRRDIAPRSTIAGIRPDALGGWRENWRVHHAARKPLAGGEAPALPRRTLLPDGLGVGQRVRDGRACSQPVQARPAPDDSPCPACGSRRARLALTYPHSGAEPWRSLTLHACPACGFGWAPTLPFSLADYYAGAYGESFKRDALPPPAEYFTEQFLARRQARESQRAVRLLEVVKDMHGPVGTLLDVGAGPGITLWHSDAATKLAVELDVHSAPYLDHAGATVVELAQIPAGSVDAVVTSHFLEHLPIEELAGVLADIRRVLAPDGVLVSEVPGGNLLSHDLTAAVHVPHTLFFTLQSLHLVVSAAGYEVDILEPSSVKDVPPLQNPWYVPTDPAFTSGRGSLVIGCRRGQRR